MHVLFPAGRKSAIGRKRPRSCLSANPRTTKLYDYLRIRHTWYDSEVVNAYNKGTFSVPAPRDAQLGGGGCSLRAPHDERTGSRSTSRLQDASPERSQGTSPQTGCPEYEERQMSNTVAKGFPGTP